MEEINVLGSRILIVDDEAANVKLLEQMLEDEGYTNIRSTLNPLEVCDIYQICWPDLVLLDLNMPKMNGFEVMEELKKIERRGNYIPVMVLTALKDEQTCIDALDAGAKDFLSKPFNMTEVLCRIKNMLEVRLLNKQIRSSNKKLELKNKKLVELNDERIKFLGMASHDMRNPLSTISGYSDLVLKEDDNLSATSKRFVEVINSSSNYLLRLLDELLDMSVIQSGKLELNLQACWLKKIIQDRVDVLQFVADKKNILLETDLKEIPSSMLDPNRISQVLDNLIGNAIKFSPTGKKIFISLQKEEEKAKIRVRDQGPGIAPDNLAKIFEPFKKADAKPTGGETSTGLGLAIVKRMVEEHNGTIEVDSIPNAGANFTVYLPFGERKPPPIKLTKEQIENTRIIVVDDDVADREYLKHHLNKFGFKYVFIADDGEVALQRLFLENVDLIISDWEMPFMSGLEFLTQIRAHPRLGKTPFIMVTSHNDLERVKQAAEKGVNQFLVKPFDGNTLKGKIEKILAQ